MLRRRPLRASFLDAFAGIALALRTQRNMRIHFVAAVLVLLSALLLRVAAAEAAFLLTAIGFVLVAEMFNTAVEKSVDLATDDYNPLAAAAKNIAAGAVLIAAVNAVIVGWLIFAPRLLPLLCRLFAG